MRCFFDDIAYENICVVIQALFNLYQQEVFMLEPEVATHHMARAVK